MTWKDLYADIQGGSLKEIYLFTGPEEFIKREALESIAKALLPPGLEALNSATLEDVGALEIIGAAETLPFMCDRRLVVVRDWGPLLPGKSRNEEDAVDRMLQWLESPPATCTLIFHLRTEPDARKKLPSALKKRGAEVRFEPLTDAEILRWANKRLKPLGKSLSQGAASQLTFAAGKDLTRLSTELDKLAAYVGERPEISPQDIAAIITPSLEFSVFEMLDFLFAGEIVRAERSLATLLTGGQTCVGILAMVIRQLRTLTHMALALRGGGNAAAVEKALKLHPYAAKRAAQQARGLDSARLEALYAACVDADFSIKSGKLRDREALQLAMLKISEKGGSKDGTG